MSTPFADVRLEIDPEERRSSAREDDQSPFDIAILGAFSGNARQDGGRVRGIHPVRVDRDDFDAVLAAVSPRIQLQVGEAPPFDLVFEELDHFHPDQLFARVPLFAELRRLRRRASDPATFAEIAREIGALAAEPTPPRSEGRRGETGGADESNGSDRSDDSDTSDGPDDSDAPDGRTGPRGSGSLLDLIVEGQAGSPEPTGVRSSFSGTDADLREVVRRITAPYVQPGPDPRLDDVLESIDAAIAEQMRSLLHHPRFQELEALWRATHLLTRRIHTGPLLRIHLIDFDRDELERDLEAGDRSALRKALDTRGGGAAPIRWALILPAYRFGADESDLRVMRGLRELSAAHGAACVAGALPTLVERIASEPASTSAASDWSDFRREPGASALGLAYPRFLLREPYGAATDPCESFRFEEIVGGARPDDFLWGDAAFLVAVMLAESFSRLGWDFHAGIVAEVDGLPMPLVGAGGEARLQPCTEQSVSDQLGARMAAAGFMPLAALPGEGAVRLLHFGSIALPEAPLAGGWSPANAP
jgi:type VI secretion system protein ImpC